jgi:allantoin racemase
LYKILYIDPVGEEHSTPEIDGFLKQIVSEKVKIDFSFLKRGPANLEYMYYETLVTADIIHKVKRAEIDGYDAVIIGCFYDPGLYQSREITDIVVVGPGEASMCIASVLGYKFSVLAGRNKWVPIIMENIQKYGYKEKLASVKLLELGVEDFHKDDGYTETVMIAKGREAVEQDGAEVIILGCTMQFGFYSKLQEYLSIPVIDPIAASVKYAEFLLNVKKYFNWGHSKIGLYQSPPIEEIKRFDINNMYNLKDIW